MDSVNQNYINTVINEGDNYYKNRDYEKSFKCFKRIAKCDTYAQYNLGFFYGTGLGVKKNDKKAYFYFKQAAEKGHNLAQYSLATLYAKGKGTLKNNELAYKWYKAAAEQGVADACYELAECYLYGKGTNVDLEKAIEWYTVALKKENENVMRKFNLNFNSDQKDLEYIIGNYLVKQNEIKKGIKLLEISASKGIVEAQEKLLEIYLEGSKDDENIEKGLYWCEVAANKNSVKAQKKLSRYFLEGKVIERDLQKAFYWYEKAASDYNYDDMMTMGLFYEYGLGVEKDFNKAKSYYENYKSLSKTSFLFDRPRHFIETVVYKYNVCDNFDIGVEIIDYKTMIEIAADGGDAKAQFLMGEFFEYSKEKKLYWYEEASKHGYLKATLKVAEYYLLYSKNKEDVLKGIALYENNINNSVQAEYQLGLCYEFGIGKSVNIKEAISLYESAAEKGYSNAQRALASIYSDKSLINDEKKKAHWDQVIESKEYKVTNYYNYSEVDKNITLVDEDAIEWYKYAAVNGDKRSQYKYALVKLQKERSNSEYWGMEQRNIYDYNDYEYEDTAVYWFLKSASLGYAPAQFMIGNFCTRDDSILPMVSCVKKDIVTAMQWYRKAEKQNFQSAKEKIQKIK